MSGAGRHGMGAGRHGMGAGRHGIGARRKCRPTHPPTGDGRR